jgi:DNA invertase Pin-like site-specific DNA recombinase
VTYEGGALPLATEWAVPPEMITNRIRAGVARVKATGVTKSGKPTGRPRKDSATEQAIRDQLAHGAGMLKIGRNLNVGTTVVQRIAKEALSMRETIDIG